MITDKRVAALERKINPSVGKGDQLLAVPEEWEDFVKNCVIRSGGLMKKFDPYPYQRRLIELRKQFKNICTIKSRQLGVTQCLSSHDLHNASLNPASSSVYFLRNQPDVGSLSRRLKTMVKGLKNYIEFENDSVSYLKLKNGGDIYLKNSSKEGTRSLDSITSQIYDESAYINDIETIYGASNASSALVENSSKILLSTPNIKSGFYWDRLSENNPEDIEKICDLVASGELYKDFPGFYYFADSKGVLKVVIHWLCHPVFSAINDTYQGGYIQYRIDTDNISEEVAQREYNLKFIDSSVSVFNGDLVRNGAVLEKFTDDINPDCDYYLAIDPSFYGDDYFSITVLEHNKKIDIYKVVQNYRKRKQTTDFHLYQCSKLINYWKPKRVCIESNSGQIIIAEQLEKSHPDLNILQIRTTSESKPVLINRIILALEKKILQYPENCILVSELLNFRRVGKSMEASSGHHDDTVMSLAFALAVCPLAKDIDNPFKDLNFDELLID